ncbi:MULTISPECIES: hypothetical protein [Trichocoleus]|uniref:Uncharacterized protein n=1 Tax=Trichocoleus desertorum GB2-A4 TaxID=2933944 RepID=A0ABV0JCV7_9CYAN|nr:hypothetical protein [Trichocoleus sp. FACHB-46]MBD1864267.1 hypothetical protein [Trichocoleus sp. FACHB-46]
MSGFLPADYIRLFKSASTSLFVSRLLGYGSLVLALAFIVCKPPSTKVLLGTFALMAAGAQHAIAAQATEQERELKMVSGLAWKAKEIDWAKKIAAIAQPMQIQEAPELFDWKLFNTKPHKYPHIAVVAETGGGKSLTAEWMASWLDGTTIVVAPHYDPLEGDFHGLPVFSGGRNYGSDKDEAIAFDDLVSGRLPRGEDGTYKVSVATVIKTIFAEMDERYQLKLKGIKRPTYNIVLDEYLATASVFTEAVNYLKLLLREARKVGLRLILLLQGDEVKALKIEGEGSLRKCLKYVRLGEVATEYAGTLGGSEPEKNPLLAFLSEQEYPVMVERKPAVTPDLTYIRERGARAGQQWLKQREQLERSQPTTVVDPEMKRNDARNIEGLSEEFLSAIEDHISEFSEPRNRDPFAETLDQIRNLPVSDRPISDFNSSFNSGSGGLNSGGNGGDRPQQRETKSELKRETDSQRRRKTINEMLSQGATQTQIIESVWGAKPGENQAYKIALVEYRWIATRDDDWPGFADPMAQYIDDWLSDRVIQLHREQLSLRNIIWHIWGVPHISTNGRPQKRARYDAAWSKLLTVLREYGLEVGEDE